MTQNMPSVFELKKRNGDNETSPHVRDVMKSGDIVYSLKDGPWERECYVLILELNNSSHTDNDYHLIHVLKDEPYYCDVGQSVEIHTSAYGWPFTKVG